MLIYAETICIQYTKQKEVILTRFYNFMHSFNACHENELIRSLDATELLLAIITRLQ